MFPLLPINSLLVSLTNRTQNEIQKKNNKIKTLSNILFIGVCNSTGRRSAGLFTFFQFSFLSFFHLTKKYNIISRVSFVGLSRFICYFVWMILRWFWFSFYIGGLFCFSFPAESHNRNTDVRWSLSVVF